MYGNWRKVMKINKRRRRKMSLIPFIEDILVFISLFLVLVFRDTNSIDKVHYWIRFGALSPSGPNQRQLSKFEPYLKTSGAPTDPEAEVNFFPTPRFLSTGKKNNVKIECRNKLLSVSKTHLDTLITEKFKTCSSTVHCRQYNRYN